MKKEIFCRPALASKEKVSILRMTDELIQAQDSPELDVPTAGPEQDSKTEDGRAVSRVVPSPTWPFELAPQQNKERLTVITQVFLSLHTTYSAFEGKGTIATEALPGSGRDEKKTLV